MAAACAASGKLYGCPLLADDFFENEVGEPEVPLFFVRMFTFNATTKRILSQKFHVTVAGNPSAIACRLVEISDCEALGSVIPYVELLCKRCKSARLDFVFYTPLMCYKSFI